MGDVPRLRGGRSARRLAQLGAVENGAQQLYGLDHRMEAFRVNETSAFHTEVRY